MSAGLYVLPAGGVDGQSPHAEDEIYVVMAGRSRFTSAGQQIDVAPGDTIFVPAHEEHRFHDIAEELSLIVCFAPPEGNSRAEFGGFSLFRGRLLVSSSHAVPSPTACDLAVAPSAPSELRYAERPSR